MTNREEGLKKIAVYAEKKKIIRENQRFKGCTRMIPQKGNWGICGNTGHFCLRSIDQNIVTWTYLAAKEAGKHLQLGGLVPS